MTKLLRALELRALPNLMRNGMCLKLRTLSSDARGELTHRPDSRACWLCLFVVMDVCGETRVCSDDEVLSSDVLDMLATGILFCYQLSFGLTVLPVL
jgi:hypothetical protein